MAKIFDIHHLFDHGDLTEFKLLVSCIPLLIHQQPSLHVDKTEWLNAFSGCDCNKLIKLARFHGVLPWLCESLALFSSTQLRGCSTQVEAILNQYKIFRFQSANQISQSEHICQLLNQAHITHLSFKGIAVLKQFYHGFVSSRLADDLDLLVDANDLPNIVELLIENGYQSPEQVKINRVAHFLSQHTQHYRWRDLSFINNKKPIHRIDLHWSIAVDDQKQLYTLPFITHFVYMCVHGHADYFFRLKNLIDLYAGMQQNCFDLQKIHHCAKHYGVEQHVAESIELAKLLFDNQATHQPSNFSRVTINRYTDNMGWSTRAHPNKATWSRQDKWQHLKRQIQQRSKKAYWFAPIVARSKLDISDAEGWNGESMLSYRLKCGLNKLT